MPATNWTEASGTETTHFEGVRVPTFDAYALFGMPIPVINGVGFSDATATFTEASVSAASWTEGSVAAQTWTETEG